MPSNNRKLAELYVSSTKISKFNEAQYQKLYRYLVALCKVSGLDAPDESVLKVCVSFIRENFFDFSQEEVEKAFNMAFAQKITNVDTNHYGNLSPQWLGRVLSGYKELRSKELIEYNKYYEKIKLEQERSVSDKEADKIMAHSIVTAYENYLKDNKFFDLGNSIYNWLTKKGYLELNNERKHILMAEARKNLVENSGNKNNADLFTRTLSSYSEKDVEAKTKSEAMTLGVIYYFNQLKRNETNIKQMLSKYL